MVPRSREMTMPGERLRAVVREALDNAVGENGYTDLLTLPVYVVAVDMLDCCADLEGARVEDIIDDIEEWRKEKANGTL